MKIISIMLVLLAVLAVACTADESKTVESQESHMPAPKPKIPEGAETITPGHRLVFLVHPKPFSSRFPVCFP